MAGDALVASGVSVEFAGVKALQDVTCTLERGLILGLIGPNGAGKTTLVNVISGFQAPTTGEVTLDGRRVTRWSAARRARAGLTRTFQGGRLFPDFTVAENVEAGCVGRGASRRAARRRSAELLAWMGMTALADTRAAVLPAGSQRRLGILRALALEPDYLLLDEPAAGLNESESEELVESIRGIRDDHGCGVLVIEHDMRVIMPLCERLHVLEHGATICLGTPAEVREDAAVLAAYLGSAA